MTWYHLVSRQRTGYTAPFPASRKFRQWPGISSSPQRPSAFAGPHKGTKNTDDSRRFNGRTRGCLPIDTPAPRPCSAEPDLSHHTTRDSLKGFACVLFSSQLFSNIRCPLYRQKTPLSTAKLQYTAQNQKGCHPERAARAEGSTHRFYSKCSESA